HDRARGDRDLDRTRPARVVDGADVDALILRPVRRLEHPALGPDREHPPGGRAAAGAAAAADGMRLTPTALDPLAAVHPALKRGRGAIADGSARWVEARRNLKLLDRLLGRRPEVAIDRRLHSDSAE